MKKIIFLVFLFYTQLGYCQNTATLKLNNLEYFEMPGLNVMVFQDIYPEGHQGGLGIIQNGERVATNGDLRLEPTPGQWQPIPKQGTRVVNKANNEIRVTLWYPDSSRNRKGFNPIEYPDLTFSYTVKVKGEGNNIIVTVDLDKDLPADWGNKVGFNFEFYPVALFGKSWLMDNQSGIFPRQPNGPVKKDITGNIVPEPMATGKKLVIASESDMQRMVIQSKGASLELYDGRNNHNNGWFVVRSLLTPGVTKEAIKWIITPYTIPNWKYKPVIHVSQVGYLCNQQKVAVVETDPADKISGNISVFRLNDTDKPELVMTASPASWGKFLRYSYYKFDFSKINQEGMYFIQMGDVKTNPFRISAEVFKRDVWQPTLEYFLPVQMCHMRVNDKYRVWHGLCHMDDALMAPVDSNLFDGYFQGPSTLTQYKPLEHVPGLNAGGWHDAGDDDLRIESQAGEMYILSLAYEAFRVDNDNTLIDETNHLAELRVPDGKPDILQQIQHGALSVVPAYRSMGRLYRGIICPTLQQYVLMGDVSNQTDNLSYNPALAKGDKTAFQSSLKDDRMVFTEKNPFREFAAAAYLAASTRALKGFNDTLSLACLQIAEQIWTEEQASDVRLPGIKIQAAIELYLTTNKEEYRKFILDNVTVITDHIDRLGWLTGRLMSRINDESFKSRIISAVASHAAKVAELEKETPFGVPYKPYIWGAGWGIQEFGVQQYFLHDAFPDIVPDTYMLNALNFVLGCHPGVNSASFASGVGSKSATVAYGYNRADYSYIPGGVVSGTALIRPDFPEMKEFPYLWQQGEYVLGGGASNFMFLVLAADHVLASGK